MASHRIPETVAAINEAAAIWLLRFEAPSCAHWQQDFLKWLDEEPRHKAAFIRLGLAWYTSETLRLLRPGDDRVPAGDHEPDQEAHQPSCGADAGQPGCLRRLND